MIKVMVVYDEDPLYAGRLAEYVNQKETFPFQAMAFSDLEKLKAYGRDHEIAILLVGERVREEAKEIKAGLKMLLCDGEGGKSYDVNMFYRSYHVDIVDTQTKYLRMKKATVGYQPEIWKTWE